MKDAQKTRTILLKTAAMILAFVIVFAVALFYQPTHWMSIQYYFDSDTKETILDLIRSSRSQILVEMYSMTSREIINALEKASALGLDVRVILDNRDENIPLAKAKFPTRWEETGRIFHRKIAIFDMQWVWIGSTNWTNQGLNENAEIDMLVSSPDEAAVLIKRFEQDWSTYKNRR